MSKGDNKSRTKNAFIVWTPFHLFNVVRYIYCNNLEGQCDLFYICQSKGMEDYCNNVKKEGVFNRIFVTTDNELHKNQKLWEYVSVLFSSKRYVRHLFGKKAISNRYELIFFSVPTRLNNAIIWSNQASEVVGYDDGIGSYTTDLYNMSLGVKYEKLAKVRRKKSICVKKVVLNAPYFRKKDDFDNRTYVSILENNLSSSENEKLLKIFGFEEKIALPKNLYLNQPMNEIMTSDDWRNLEMDIIGSIAGYTNNDIVVRLHPREKKKKMYEGFKIDEGNQMWELICDSSINSSSVLISTFSTAQFTPKLIFDKEPWVICTFLLLKDYMNNDMIKRMNTMTERIKNCYRDKNKIMIPKNKEELFKCLKIATNND